MTLVARVFNHWSKMVDWRSCWHADFAFNRPACLTCALTAALQIAQERCLKPEHCVPSETIIMMSGLHRCIWLEVRVPSATRAIMSTSRPATGTLLSGMSGSSRFNLTCFPLNFVRVCQGCRVLHPAIHSARYCLASCSRALVRRECCSGSYRLDDEVSEGKLNPTPARRSSV